MDTFDGTILSNRHVCINIVKFMIALVDLMKQYLIQNSSNAFEDRDFQIQLVPILKSNSHIKTRGNRTFPPPSKLHSRVSTLEASFRHVLVWFPSWWIGRERERVYKRRVAAELCQFSLRCSCSCAAERRTLPVSSSFQYKRV